MAWYLMGRLVVLNITALSFLVLAHLYGWTDEIVARDTSYISVLIFGVFVLGLLYALGTGLYISRQFQILKCDDLEGMETRLGNRLGVVSEIASSLVLLGLIGTVFGFIVALIQPDGINVADANMAKQVLSQLVNGMGIALYTTLVGSVLNLWLRFNYRIIYNASGKLMAALRRVNTHAS